jgi:hypothetical protein
MGRPKKVVEEPKKEAPKKRVSRKTKMAAGRPTTAAAAIKLFCQECMGFQPKVVRDCSDPRCPLFDFRLAGIEPTDISVRTKDG